VKKTANFFSFFGGGLATIWGPVPPSGTSVETPLIASFQPTRSTILMSAAWFSAIYVSSHIDQVDARRAHAMTQAKMWYGKIKMPCVPYQLQSGTAFAVSALPYRRRRHCFRAIKTQTTRSAVLCHAAPQRNAGCAYRGRA